MHFDFDRYSLRPEATRVLDEAVAALQENPTLRVEIEGHTCNIGTAEYNLALGDRRANAVRDYLVEPRRHAPIGCGRSATARSGRSTTTPRGNAPSQSPRRARRPADAVEGYQYRISGTGTGTQVQDHRRGRQLAVVRPLLLRAAVIERSGAWYLVPGPCPRFPVPFSPMSIKASAAAEIRQLTAALRGEDEVRREAAIARLAIIGARAVDALLRTYADTADRDTRIAVLRTLEPIGDRRTIAIAREAITGGGDLAQAAASALRGLLDSPHDRDRHRRARRAGCDGAGSAGRALGSTHGSRGASRDAGQCPSADQRSAPR